MNNFIIFLASIGIVAIMFSVVYLTIKVCTFVDKVYVIDNRLNNQRNELDMLANKTMRFESRIYTLESKSEEKK